MIAADVALSARGDCQDAGRRLAAVGSEMQVLRMIAELFVTRRGRPLQMTDIALRAGWNAATTISMVQSLVARGWITQDSADTSGAVPVSGPATDGRRVPHPRMAPESVGAVTGITAPGWAALDAPAVR